MKTNIILQGDALTKLKELPDESINCVMTSPPYFNQRDYGMKGQLGLEEKPEEYVMKLCDIFSEVKRVLRNDGICWVNISDCYGGYQGKNNGYPDRKNEPAKIPQIKRSKTTAKSLLCVPEMFLLEMVKRGWLIRNKIIWYKNNVMPSSAKDRFTIDYEMLYFFVKNKKYYFKQQFEPHLTKENRPHGCVRERELGYDSKYNKIHYKEHSIRQKRGGNKNPDYRNPEGRNKRCVWEINTKPSKVKHFAIYPEKLIWSPVDASCPEGGIVLDPFFGAGTTGLVALKQNKKFIGIELNKEYIKIAKARIKPFLEQRKLK